MSYIRNYGIGLRGSTLRLAKTIKPMTSWSFNFLVELRGFEPP